MRRQVEWHRDFFYPFVGRWAERVHALTGGKKMVFLEAIPNEVCCDYWVPAQLLYLSFLSLVLSFVMDPRQTAAQYGVRPPLV